MQILFEDKEIIVCHKPSGIATQTAKIGQRDMVSEISNYLSASVKGKPYVGLIHRLDQPVEGILVFAKNPKAAAALSKQITANEMQKKYYAVVAAEAFQKESQNGLRANEVGANEPEANKPGANGQQEGREPNKTAQVLIDYLYKDGKTNTSSVVSKETKDAKRAELYYELAALQEAKKIALVKITLVTGRHHQIRVQMSHAGMSLLGDYKYAEEKIKELSNELGQKQVALCAYELGFKHPVTGEKLTFQTMPSASIFQEFSDYFVNGFTGNN